MHGTGPLMAFMFGDLHVICKGLAIVVLLAYLTLALLVNN